MARAPLHVQEIDLSGRSAGSGASSASGSAMLFCATRARTSQSHAPCAVRRGSLPFWVSMQQSARGARPSGLGHAITTRRCTVRQLIACEPEFQS